MNRVIIMFENLSDRLQNVMHKIKGYGKITEDTAMFKQRFSAECPQNSPCSLEIKSTEAPDSALYFCASSQSTVLHVSSS